MPISLSGSLNLSGSLTTTGTITATTLVVETITSSISSITGSTNFGSLSSNTHKFTGSLNASGSGNFSGSLTATDLIVSDTYANDPLIKLVTTTSGNVEVQMRTTTTTYNAGIGVVTSGYDFSLFTNNTTRLFISSSGNVGIGTSSPNRLLDVSSGGDTYLRVAGNRGNADDLHVANVEFYNSNSTRIIAEIRAITGTGGTQSNSGQLAFYTNNAGTYAERMRITSGGNVGIGTSTVNSKFIVIDNAEPNASGNITTGTQFAASIASGFASLNLGAYDNGSSIRYGYLRTAYSDNAGSPSEMRFYTGATERMRITSAGDVYIGSSTTNKSSRLVVYGEDTVGNYYALRCYSVGSDILFGVRTDGYINSGTFTNSPYNLVRTGRVMMVDSSGGVGYQSSTRESKTNINNLTDISFLYQLNPVSFNYRKTEEISNTFTDEYNEDLHYGLIADEVEKVNKELVFYNEKNGQKEVAGVEYGKLTAVLVKAIQELTARVQYLENK